MLANVLFIVAVDAQAATFILSNNIPLLEDPLYIDTIKSTPIGKPSIVIFSPLVIEEIESFMFCLCANFLNSGDQDSKNEIKETAYFFFENKSNKTLCIPEYLEEISFFDLMHSALKEFSVLFKI